MNSQFTPGSGGSTDSMFRLRDIIAENRAGRRRGTYAVCSAHPWVIDTAVQQALENRSLLHIESTASQVNQFGGYSGNTPHQFATRIRAVAQNAGLASEQVLLGGDHVGPFPWRHEASSHAMTKASQLVRECVLAGYSKIHLDASMPCADDPKSPLDDRVVAERAAILCNAAEEASRELPPGFSPLYVIGTEVPAPGGESASGGSPQVTTVENVEATLQAFHAAFVSRNLSAAWERVIGLVVQPGVEFGDHTVFDYDRNKTQALSAALPSHPPLVFEAHSTDYQAPGALAQMVDDHFAILKVGPWLTFAFRQAVFALAAIESEMLGGRKGLRLLMCGKSWNGSCCAIRPTGSRTIKATNPRRCYRGPTVTATAAGTIGTTRPWRARSNSSSEISPATSCLPALSVSTCRGSMRPYELANCGFTPSRSFTSIFETCWDPMQRPVELVFAKTEGSA